MYVLMAESFEHDKATIFTDQLCFVFTIFSVFNVVMCLQTNKQQKKEKKKIAQHCAR